MFDLLPVADDPDRCSNVWWIPAWVMGQRTLTRGPVTHVTNTKMIRSTHRFFACSGWMRRLICDEKDWNYMACRRLQVCDSASWTKPRQKESASYRLLRIGISSEAAELPMWKILREIIMINNDMKTSSSLALASCNTSTRQTVLHYTSRRAGSNSEEELPRSTPLTRRHLSPFDFSLQLL